MLCAIKNASSDRSMTEKRNQATLVQDRSIAYFSMEVALESGMPTYSGGLGILAGDTIRSAADLSVLMVVVSLL